MSRARKALARAERRLLRRYTYSSPLTIGGLRLSYDRRPSAALMGRFGGGWQWVLGVQVGTVTRSHWSAIINLLVCSVRIRYDRKARP